MKKVIWILILVIFFNTQLLAEVYYCIDKGNSGFKFNNGKYDNQNYLLKKFKAKIDFDQGIFESKDLKMDFEVNCMSRISDKYSMSCASPYGEIFTIEGDKTSMDIFNYVRAQTYGRGDSILVAHGNCEKF